MKIIKLSFFAILSVVLLGAAQPNQNTYNEECYDDRPIPWRSTTPLTIVKDTHQISLVPDSLEIINGADIIIECSKLNGNFLRLVTKCDCSDKSLIVWDGKIDPNGVSNVIDLYFVSYYKKLPPGNDSMSYSRPSICCINPFYIDLSLIVSKIRTKEVFINIRNYTDKKFLQQLIINK